MASDHVCFWFGTLAECRAPNECTRRECGYTGDPLAGSEQRGAAAKLNVGDGSDATSQAESQSAPHPQRGAASSTPHQKAAGSSDQRSGALETSDESGSQPAAPESAAPQVPQAARPGPVEHEAQPAVAAPSAVEEVRSVWAHIYNEEGRGSTVFTTHFRHARELDKLRNKVIDQQNEIADAWNDARVLRVQRDEMQAEVREWLCEKCNTVYPGPPQKGFASVQCPKCKGRTAPRTIMELRQAKRRLEALEGALKWYEDNSYRTSYERVVRAIREHAAQIEKEAK